MLVALYVMPGFLCLLGLWEFFAETRERTKRHFDFQETFSSMCTYNLHFFRLLLAAPAILLYQYLFRISTPWHHFWPESALLSWCIAFVIADFVFYVFHVISHRWNILWGTHLVHHQPEYWNLSVAGRDSIFGRFVLCLLGLPLALTGLPPFTYYSAVFVGLVSMAWTHTRLIGRLGVLEYVLNTPQHHKIHHYKDVARMGGTKNFAGIFIIWDRLFGTFWQEKEESGAAFAYGIDGLPAAASVFRSQTFFYQHLFGILRRAPRGTRLKILFSEQLPEPPPPLSERFPDPSRHYGVLDWIYCFLLSLLTFQCTTTLTVRLVLGFADASLDSATALRLLVACGATALGVYQISRILRKAAGSAWSSVASIAALSLAAAYLEGAFVGAPATRLILFVVSSRAVLALGALAGLL